MGDTGETGRRVAITGVGMVSPLGNDAATSWEALVAGRSGAGRITHFDPSQHGVKIAAEVKGFDPLNYMDRKLARRTEPYAHYALAAAREAVADSGLDVAAEGDDVGVLVGSGAGGLKTLEDGFKPYVETAVARVNPLFLTMQVADMAGAYISMEYGARGPSFATVSACATGAHAIGEAAEIIKRGDAKAMIAGGAEAGITSMAIAAFATMRALSASHNDDPTHASRPFDAARDGFVMGEGAGVVVLEDEEHAKARGAHIYAIVAGYGATADAHHITEPAPQGAGLARAIGRALRKANIKPEQIEYVNAHGTSTVFNDRDETAALHTVFGEHAKKLAVSSTKSMTGHMVGAAGGVEAIITALALDRGILPPTINYETPDPACDLDYIPNASRKQAISYALSNSMGFGGHNATILLTRPEVE